MKNLLLSICLLLMSVSALAQENVLSETWVPKLDLTIPSSEMPSTLGLDSKDKHAIMRGWTCCYRNELINAVQIEHLEKSIEYSSKANQKKLEFTPHFDNPTKGQWALFYTLQILDVYTTYRGLKYDCVWELNPIVGEQPSVKRMVFTKIALLTPAMQYDMKNDNLNEKSFNQMNFMMGIVVANNYDVLHRAKRYCNKR